MNALFWKRALLDQPLLEESVLSHLASRLDVGISRFDETKGAELPQFQKLREALRPKMEVTSEGVAVLPVEGVLARKPDLWELAMLGYEDTEEVLKLIQEAGRDSKIQGILLKVDSPGGFVVGGAEVADAVSKARKNKPVIAHTSGTMASLAYWIGSQAEEVIASRSAQVGSIGVYTTFIDRTEALANEGVKVEVIKNAQAELKAAGVMGTALTPEQRSHFIEKTESVFKEFEAAVKEARPGITQEAMKGQVLWGKNAKQAGLLDRVGDQYFAMSVLKEKIRRRNS